mmetsp:Transcript_34421/g.56151  ORF Transcript_34421/g.56151 Transcript_34421/m.56151 type:complete len:245 (-) Transcript_34421:729-1463(-)
MAKKRKSVRDWTRPEDRSQHHALLLGLQVLQELAHLVLVGGVPQAPQRPRLAPAREVRAAVDRLRNLRDRLGRAPVNAVLEAHDHPLLGGQIVKDLQQRSPQLQQLRDLLGVRPDLSHDRLAQLHLVRGRGAGRPHLLVRGDGLPAGSYVPLQAGVGHVQLLRQLALAQRLLPAGLRAPLLAAHAVQQVVHVHWQPDGARVVGQRLHDGLLHPPGRVGAELEPPAGVVFLRGPDQAQAAFLNEV